MAKERANRQGEMVKGYEEAQERERKRVVLMNHAYGDYI